MIKELERLFGVSGYEKPVCDYLMDEIKPYCQNIWIDSIGNLHAEKKGAKCSRNVFLAVYMDEPGIIITNITEDGYLKFETIGRIRPEFLVSKQVIIGKTIGIISLKAIHLTTKEERAIPVKSSGLFIDIGAKTKEEAEKIIDIGDYGAINSRFIKLGNGFIKGHALGSRIGCKIAVDILKQDLNCELHVVFAAQREIDSRGMRIASNNINADTAIFLEGVPADAWESTESFPQSGAGVVLLKQTNSGIIQEKLLKTIYEIAERNKIKFQSYSGNFNSQDIALKQNGYNNLSLVLGIPVKYFESPSQVAAEADIYNAEQMVCKYITHVVKEEEVL